MFKSKSNNQSHKRGFKGRRSFGGKSKGLKFSTPKKAPAECTVKALQDHYFDCSGYNEADRYPTTKRAILQYMGTKFGGDIRMTLESGR